MRKRRQYELNSWNWCCANHGRQVPHPGYVSDGVTQDPDLEGPCTCLRLCWHYLNILNNFWVKGPAFAFGNGSFKLFHQSSWRHLETWCFSSWRTEDEEAWTCIWSGWWYNSIENAYRPGEETWARIFFSDFKRKGLPNLTTSSDGGFCCRREGLVANRCALWCHGMLTMNLRNWTALSIDCALCSYMRFWCWEADRLFYPFCQEGYKDTDGNEKVSLNWCFSTSGQFGQA